MKIQHNGLTSELTVLAPKESLIHHMVVRFKGKELELTVKKGNNQTIISEAGMKLDLQAKPILREINERFGLEVPLLNGNQNLKNTRTLGRHVGDALLDLQQNV